MEKKTMGSFIAALRKARGMTQQDVADRLNVSNKTVSKWERDEGYPEITMLPVIAELFEVTTDELLRGERIFRNDNSAEPSRNVKAEKYTRYIFDRAMTKFTNLSVVSVALGISSMFIAYLADYIIVSLDKRWIAIVLTLLLTVASLIIQIIAFNSLKPNLNAEDAPEKDVTAKGKRKSALYLSLTAMLAVTSLVGITTYIIDEFVAFLMLIPGLLLGLIVAFITYSLVVKNAGIDEKTEHSAEYLCQRKKHIKATSIIVTVVCIFSAVFPFAGTLIDYWFSESSYCFTEEIGYQYNSAEEAKNEYNKLKGYFEGRNELYYILDEYEEELLLVVHPVGLTFDVTEKGVYNIVSANASITVMMQDILDGDYYHQKEFSTKAELEEFKKKYVWDDDSTFCLDILEREIRFDDEALTIYWKQSGPRLYQAFDIMSVFVLGGSAISLIIIGISVFLWNGKKKRIV